MATMVHSSSITVHSASQLSGRNYYPNSVSLLSTSKAPWLLFGLHQQSSYLRGHLQVSAISSLDAQMYEDLKAGSPIVIIEAPPLLKTAEPMPMLRANKGLVKPGDAGRILGRKPKDVWAVRFAVGAYLIDKKYFKPLDLS